MIHEQKHERFSDNSRQIQEHLRKKSGTIQEKIRKQNPEKIKNKIRKRSGTNKPKKHPETCHNILRTRTIIKKHPATLLRGLQLGPQPHVESTLPGQRVLEDRLEQGAVLRSYLCLFVIINVFHSFIIISVFFVFFLLFLFASLVVATTDEPVRPAQLLDPRQAFLVSDSRAEDLGLHAPHLLQHIGQDHAHEDTSSE